MVHEGRDEWLREETGPCACEEDDAEAPSVGHVGHPAVEDAGDPWKGSGFSDSEEEADDEK
jgi:hypothetical protein